jgi:hypothetical protein
MVRCGPVGMGVMRRPLVCLVQPGEPACGTMRRMAHRAAPVTSGPRFEGVPGWELVDAGMTDLAAGRLTIESELVRSASDRLRGLGLNVPPGDDQTNQLYALIEAEVGPARAHGRYNALRRRLTSFLRAAPGARPG